MWGFPESVLTKESEEAAAIKHWNNGQGIDWAVTNSTMITNNYNHSVTLSFARIEYLSVGRNKPWTLFQTRTDPHGFLPITLLCQEKGKSSFLLGSVGDDQLCIPWDLGSEEAPITFILPVPLHWALGTIHHSQESWLGILNCAEL